MRGKVLRFWFLGLAVALFVIGAATPALRRWDTTGNKPMSVYPGAACTAQFVTAIGTDGSVTCADATGGGGAPSTSKYLIQTADAGLPNAQVMGALVTGLVVNTTVTGVQSIYSGVNCTPTNQFLTALTGTGAGTCTTATLAGAQFANQGTTTTLLHGNVAGNPSWGAVVTADITDANVTYAKMQNISAASLLLGRGSAGGAGSPQEITVGANCTMSGTTFNCTGSSGTAQTDLQLFIPGPYCMVSGASPTTLSVVRNAAGNMTYRYTGATTQDFFDCSFPAYNRTTSGKGLKLTSVDVTYGIATTALTAHTATLQERCFSNGVANAMTDKPITGTLATATAANPYTTVLTVTTPAFENTSDCEWNLELAVTPNTTLYDLYGVTWHFTRQD